MVLDTTVIEAEIKVKVDKGSVASAKKETEKIGKELDNVLEPEIKFAKLKQQLAQVNTEIRAAKKRGEKDRVLSLTINQRRIRKEISDVNKEIDKLSGRTSGLTRLFNKAGAAIAGAFAARAVIGGITNIVNSFSEATSTIIKETGATGDALEGLQSSFQTVFGQVPQSAQEVGQAIGDVSTRFGVVGDELESLTKDFLDFARVTGTDVSTSIRTVSRLAQDFGLSVTETPLLLDKLTAASQATGVEVSKLANTATNFGVQFRALGFGLDETVALLSKFEAEGVSVEKITSGLSIALGKLAKEGIDDPIEGFRELTSRIKEAGSVGDATRTAIDLLGSRAGPDFALAVREGRLEFEDFIGTIQGAQGTLEQTAQASLTVGERLKIAFNGLITTAKPVFDFLGEGLISVIDGFNFLGDSVLNTIDIFKGLLGSEEAIERLRDRNQDLVEAADETNIKIQELTGSIKDNSAEMTALSEQYTNGAISAEEYDKKVNDLKESNRQLSLEQKALTITQSDVQNAINAFNTASSQTEFNRLRQAALDAVQAMIIAKRLALDESFKKGTPLISAGIFEATQELAALETQFKEIQFATFQGAPAASGGGAARSGGGGKSAATVAKEKELKEIARLEEQAIRDAEKRAEEEAKITEQVFKDAFDAIGDKIKEKEKDLDSFTDAIDKSVDKIADIDQKIADLGSQTGGDLASRFVAVESELDTETDFLKRKALEDELELIRQNTTAEERKEAVRQEGLTETEKILEARDAELAILEEQKAAEQIALDAATEGRDNALAQIENLRSIEKTLSDEAIAQTELEFLKKAEAAQGYADVLDDIISKQSQAGLITAGGDGAIPTAGAGGTTTINEGDVSIDIQTGDVADPQDFVDLVSQRLAQQIQDTRRQNL